MRVKICSKCKIEKDLSCFYRLSAKEDKYRSACKTCTDNQNKTWGQNNQEQRNEYLKNYRIETKESRLIWQKDYDVKRKDKRLVRYRENKVRLNKESNDYYHKNKETLRPKRTKWEKQKLANDPDYKLKHIIRGRFSKAIKKQFKSGSAVRDLGMSIHALLVYLNLDCLDKYGEPYTGNESKYHIDHIKPLSSYDLSDRMQLLEAVNWRNLQILTITENLRKGSNEKKI